MEPSPASRRWSSPALRLLLLGALMLLLQAPLGMIGGVVGERAARRGDALADITSHWGGAQALVGPLLHLACAYRVEEHDEHGKASGSHVENRDLYVMPERLDVTGTLATETRHRGIFSLPVYSAALRLQGTFARPDRSLCPGVALGLDSSTLDFVIGLAEPRSLRAETGLIWDGARVELKPATGIEADLLRSGVHAPLPGGFAGESASFSLVLGFNGSDSLMLAPLARQTSASLQADWPHPAFQGASLPLHHEEQANGFDAAWSISYLGRDYAQTWSAVEVAAVTRSLFGVRLATPADPYVQAQRICRYAVLTLVLTFGTIWLTELLAGVRVHPVQYGFLGAALCLFSLLQLSFAEHFGFDAAFALAAACVLAQVTLYAQSLLHRWRRSLTVGAVLGGLYGYLYAILTAEDYALLGGTLALFGLLSAAMYLTRRLDWSGGAAASA